MITDFQVRSLDAPGGWSTNHRRYYDYAEQSLVELEEAAASVIAAWPKDAPDILARDDLPSGVHELCRRRDRLSDATKLFAAMAAESFINCYGVVRLGEDQFNRHVERLPVTRKLQLLLLVCDSVVASEGDELIAALDHLVQRRNRLAHPKSRPVELGAVPDTLRGSPVPEDARGTVAALRRFYELFQAAVPASSRLIPEHRVA